MSPTLSAPVPILRSFSEREARDFYLRYLGFKVVWEHRFAPHMPLYMEVARGGCTLHLSEHHGDTTPGIRIRVPVDEVAALLDEISVRSHPRMNPGLQDQPWGAREMTVIDPFSNRLTFWSPLPKPGGSTTQ